jgi:hypothetical protein
MAFVYCIMLIAAGVFFYVLRTGCLVLYGLSEFLFALLLMFLWCWPQGPILIAVGGGIHGYRIL